MLEFIALHVYTIAIVAGVLAIIGGLFIIGATIPSSDEDICITIGACIILVNMAVLGILGINTKGSYPVSHAQWKTIYTNDLNADVKVAYKDFSDKHSISTNQKQKIKDFQSALDENDSVINIKLTATKGENSITKNVLLEKDNVIANDIDPNNARIAKIEYRPIEGTAPKVFGVKSRPSKSDEDGEIRITFTSNNDKQLEALFKTGKE